MNRRIVTWDVMGRWGRTARVLLGRVELVQFGTVYHALFRPAASDDEFRAWSSGPDAVDTIDHVLDALKVAYGGMLL